MLNVVFMRLYRNSVSIFYVLFDMPAVVVCMALWHGALKSDYVSLAYNIFSLDTSIIHSCK